VKKAQKEPPLSFMKTALHAMMTTKAKELAQRLPLVRIFSFGHGVQLPALVFPSPPPVKRLSISVSTGPGGHSSGRLLGNRAGAALGAGIVDRHIEPPEALDGLIYQAPHLFVMANIGANKFGLGAKRA
jgi:hypothetical protein